MRSPRVCGHNPPVRRDRLWATVMTGFSKRGAQAQRVVSLWSWPAPGLWGSNWPDPEKFWDLDGFASSPAKG